MNINDFFNKKCYDNGWEDFAGLIGDSTTDHIRSCVISWTGEYVELTTTAFSEKLTYDMGLDFDNEEEYIEDFLKELS